MEQEMNNKGKQSIGCDVSSCANNENGCECRLKEIQIRPCAGCHSGCAEDESCCGSYASR